MIDYKKNRLYYGEQISPPPGYTLEQAVATTYSLNLIALLSIPVALFYSANLDGEVNENRDDIFYSIQKTTDKLKVYCQRSKIKSPENAHKLIAFIEDCITEIQPDSHHKSFHPKIWVLRFIGKNKKTIYRFLVMSRNLTFSRDWDVAFCTEGYVTSSMQNNNKPLVDYIRHLAKASDFKNSKKFIRDLNKVSFNVMPPFSSLEFFPSGIKGYPNPLKNEVFKDIIIVSPFLDATTLKQFSQNTKIKGKKYLFSRKEELDKIHASILEPYKVYSFSNRIVDAEEDMDIREEDGIPMLQNLHAKLYVASKPDGTNKWYLGSANFSSAAFDRNEEFLVGLESRAYKCSVPVILSNLLTKDHEIEVFEEYTRVKTEPQITNEFDFRQHTHNLLNLISNKESIDISCDQDTESLKYNIKVKTADFRPVAHDIRISFAPYGDKGDLQKFEPNSLTTFEGMALHHVSPFFTWQIEHIPTEQQKKFITRMDFKLPEGRQQAIIRSFFQDKDKFLQFIQFLLGQNSGLLDSVAGISAKNEKGMDNTAAWSLDTPLLEDLLLASSRNPQKLADIHQWIERIKDAGSEDVIPDGFLNLWNAFKEINE
jgi:hypothetical protein